MRYDLALVVGAGAFGTSIASVLANNFEKVVLKVRSQDNYESLKKGENSIYLPGIKLPENIIPALSWEEVDSLSEKKCELVVSGLPTQGIKVFFSEKELIDLFKRTGLTEISSQFQGYLVPPLAEVVLFPQWFFGAIAKVCVFLEGSVEKVMVGPFARLSWNMTIYGRFGKSR